MKGERLAPMGLGIGLALCFLALMSIAIAARPARAHGDAGWIMVEPRFVDREGVHCCGPSDCRAANDGEVIETQGGVLVRGKFVAYADIGHHRSIDERHWLCERGGLVRCVFRPLPGS